MRLNLVVFVLFCFILLGGCSQIPGVGTGKKEIISNDALVVNFNTKTNFLPLIEYELVLINRGGNSVELRKEDISVLTIEKMQLSSQKDVITQDSLDDFYAQIFRDSNVLVIGPEQRRVITGSFMVENEYYLSTVNRELTLLLNIKYDYKTDVYTNVVLNTENRRISNDRFVQAAPVVVENLDLLVIDSSNYRILFDVVNKGDASIVEIENFDFSFGNNRLNCIPYGISGDNRDENILTISRSHSYLTFSCVLPSSYLDESGSINSVFFGEFNYNYEIGFSKKVNFPEQRQSSFN